MGIVARYQAPESQCWSRKGDAADASAQKTTARPQILEQSPEDADPEPEPHTTASSLPLTGAEKTQQQPTATKATQYNSQQDPGLCPRDHFLWAKLPWRCGTRRCSPERSVWGTRGSRGTHTTPVHLNKTHTTPSGSKAPRKVICWLQGLCRKDRSQKARDPAQK